MAGDALIGAVEAARIAGLAPATVRRYAHRESSFPPPVKMDGVRSLLYRRADVEAWAARRAAHTNTKGRDASDA